MNKYDFIEEKIKEVKQEIKHRKKWKTALYNEYGKVRTQREHRQDDIIKLIDIANIIIRYNEVILEQYKLMLKEVKEKDKK